MWNSIKMPSGRWFVVRHVRGKKVVRREFYKNAWSSVAFHTEEGAIAQAKKLNAAAA